MTFEDGLATAEQLAEKLKLAMGYATGLIESFMPGASPADKRAQLLLFVEKEVKSMEQAAGLNSFLVDWTTDPARLSWLLDMMEGWRSANAAAASPPPEAPVVEAPVVADTAPAAPADETPTEVETTAEATTETPADETAEAAPDATPAVDPFTQESPPSA